MKTKFNHIAIKVNTFLEFIELKEKKIVELEGKKISNDEFQKEMQEVYKESRRQG